MVVLGSKLMLSDLSNVWKWFGKRPREPNCPELSVVSFSNNQTRCELMYINKEHCKEFYDVLQDEFSTFDRYFIGLSLVH